MRCIFGLASRSPVFRSKICGNDRVAAVISRQFTAARISVLLTWQRYLDRIPASDPSADCPGQQRGIFGVDRGAYLGRQCGRSLWLSFMGRGSGGHRPTRLLGFTKCRDALAVPGLSRCLRRWRRFVRGSFFCLQVCPSAAPAARKSPLGTNSA
jgi:hypothetical protein